MGRPYQDGIKPDMSASSPAKFWASIKDTGKPYWVTEGGTGSHDWPKPLTGVAAAIHNNFVHGHASAFVPWQISGAEPTTHNLMVRDTMTKKTHAVRHFARFIEEGAYRVAASPDEHRGLAASAYLHPETGELAIVLINSSPRSRQIDLKLEGDRTFRILQITRTSAEENFFDGGNVSLENRRATVTIPAQRIITLSGHETSRRDARGHAETIPE